MMDRTTRVAASSRMLAKLCTRMRTSVTARGVVHTIAAVIAPLSFVFALSLSLAARADDQTGVQSLIGKVSWTGNPTAIYLLNSVPVSTNALPADGKFDNLVLKYTDTSAVGTLTLDDTIRANARILVVGGGGAGGNASGLSIDSGAGGGGGAGGFIDTTQTLVSGTYSITVGAGGTAAATTATVTPADCTAQIWWPGY